ncbi:MAG: hypothetical protein P4N59_29530 [Negativicutes bacterium]|nr:hypothetical protein [Negativicutes bacterium]
MKGKRSMRSGYCETSDRRAAGLRLTPKEDINKKAKRLAGKVVTYTVPLAVAVEIIEKIIQRQKPKAGGMN